MLAGGKWGRGLLVGGGIRTGGGMLGGKFGGGWECCDIWGPLGGSLGKGGCGIPVPTD